MTEAKRITEALHGRWNGHSGLARCPAHDDRNPSLSLSDGAAGRLLAKCMTGCSFVSVLDALRGLGIIEGKGQIPMTDPAELAQYQAEQREAAEKKERQALAVWREAQPITGTVAETYLRCRGITADLRDTLRFHPSCWHSTARRLPAMVAMVEGADRFAVHRTYLRPDGSGKAEVVPEKAMLGATAGGAVRLSEGLDALAIAEGIENALSLMCGPLCGSVAVWAALSTSGMASLRLPPRAGSLIVATDGDTPGKSAGTKLAERASAQGWSVTMFPAPDGRDWNDVVQDMKGAAA
jgi:phage/plasmid primase-like uncharacterized protein